MRLRAGIASRAATDGSRSPEPRPAVRGTGGAATHRRRRSARRGRRPTRWRWALRRSDPVTARGRPLARAESSEAAIDDPVPADTRRRIRHGPAADRILLAHVDALAAHRRGDRSAARRAISRGLAAAMASQAALGSIETRAHAAVHGNALAEIGARMAVADRRPRELLARIEATRVMAARTPAFRPPTDPELARLLAELRSHEVTLADASVADAGASGCRARPCPPRT